MVWTLTESYIGVTHSPQQEHAIVELLSRIRRWRHMIETLEHMSVDGKKVEATDGLNRINSFLLDKQQEDFNTFLDSLAVHGAPTVPAARYAWDTSQSIMFSQDKRKVLAAAARSPAANSRYA